MSDEHGCTPEMVREHEQRITATEESVKSAHLRMNNLEDFKDTMLEMNGNIKVIAEQIKAMAETLIRHEDAIEDIQQKMETKDSIKRLYETVDDLEVRMSDEENKDAQAALKAMNKIKWWILAGFGGIILAIVGMYLGLR